MTTYRDAIEKLNGLRLLPEGWNYGSGAPISAQAQRFSLAALHVLHSIGADRLDVLPSDDGGATILASMNADVAEIVVRREGNCELFLERGDLCDEYELLNLSDLISTLEDAGWRSPKSSGSRTHVFTVKSTKGSPARPFAKVVPEPRSLIAHVWRPLGVRFATTSTNITEGWEDSRQSSVDSLSRPYLVAQG